MSKTNLNQSYDRQVFRHTANKTKAINLNAKIRRGGTRL